MFGDLEFWRFLLSALTFIGVTVTVCFNWYSHQKIVYNDFAHTAADLKTLINKVDALQSQLNTLATDVAYLKGNMDSCLANKKTLRKTK
jgi:uncharacterized protein YlxW (UPF0749 family)